MYPFVFNPFGRNNTVNILDLVIPKVKTIAIGESTENVVLGICPKVWCRLPKEGVIVLEVRHTAEASGAMTNQCHRHNFRCLCKIDVSSWI